VTQPRAGLSGPLATLARAAAPEFDGFMEFHDRAERADGAIPAKYRELMAVAVGLTTQCQTCIERHTKRAKEAGATEQELAETVFVAAAVRAGGAVVHGMLAVKAYGGAGS
jgi:AhpD family alkylhydroperoxidase